MNKYKVKQTDILHNGKMHPEGTIIELDAKQAASLEDYLELIQEIKKQQAKPAKAAQKEAGTAKEPEKQDDTQNTEGADSQNNAPENIRRD